MATAAPILNIQSSDNELSKQTVFIKLHLGLLGNSRKVSSSRVEVDADKALIRVSKTLLDSPELQAIRTLDGDIRNFVYDMCLPFEVGIHFLPLGLVETVDEKLREFSEKRSVLVEVFLAAYPRLCQEAAGRLRTLYNPTDYPPVDEVRSHFTFSWQYVSYGATCATGWGISRTASRSVCGNQRCRSSGTSWRRLTCAMSSTIRS